MLAFIHPIKLEGRKKFGYLVQISNQVYMILLFRNSFIVLEFFVQLNACIFVGYYF